MTTETLKSVDLRGQRILVTRPAHQAGLCCQHIETCGGHAIAFPLLEIQALPDSDPLLREAKSHILDLDLFDQLIFVSPNAARMGASLIDDYWPQPPVRQIIHAIGSKTAEHLNDYGLDAESNLLGYDSESLLKSKSLVDDIGGQRILILRGVGGRELLADTLTSRGADVFYANLYQRRTPIYSTEQKQEHLFNALPDIILITSGEALNNIVNMAHSVLHNKKENLGNAELPLLNVPIVVPSNRIAEQAKTLGFTRITTANGPDDIHMIKAAFDNHDVDSNL